ncbi:MAG: NADPH-dependent 7-cyano-7-deazaguanine reductase QueF [Proteobacteria bacterium]|nr:NADPH-dependent 7-cyano-7-deazaguanine reductase QueF [Pseudomonadota bacterium]
MDEPAANHALGPLGQPTHYTSGYDPALLFRVLRAEARARLAAEPWPLVGDDEWTAWEASWLDATGRPQVAVLRFGVPSTSPAIVESKSVKLYLTALNDVVFADADDYRRTVARDLAFATGGDVRVELIAPADATRLARVAPVGTCIDDAPLAPSRAGDPDAAVLATAGAEVDETLYTERFRSVCPVTGQPDYACIQVAYRGPRLDRGALLAYLLAYRHHPGFHEHCVERIALDVWRQCRPARLAVSARFTRRGGIDINPWRHAGEPMPAPPWAPTPTQ